MVTAARATDNFMWSRDAEVTLPNCSHIFSFFSSESCIVNSCNNYTNYPPLSWAAIPDFKVAVLHL